MSVETFPTKVKGTSFYSVPFDFIQAGDEVSWKRDPGNKYDPNAISLWWQGQQIGHLSADLARDLAPQVDAGRVSLGITVSSVTGGGQMALIPGAAKKEKGRGINLEVVVNYNENALAEALAFPSGELNLFD